MLFQTFQECIKRVEKIVGRSLETVDLDVRDKKAIDELFNKHQFYAVLHFAALKAVGESIAIPLDYYKTNVFGTINILEVSLSELWPKIVFESRMDL